MKENTVKRNDETNKTNGVTRFLKIWFLPIAFMIVVTLVVVHLINRNLKEIETTVNDTIIGKEGEVRTITESDLKDIVMQSKLYTIDYPYNGYVDVRDDEGEVKYYVAYKGSVKAGIDVNEIEYSIDEENSVIKITLPEVTIEEPVVEAGSMDFIFIDDDENTEDVAQEAYKCSIADIKNQVKNDNKLVEEANKSAEATERALIEPWIDQYDEKNYEIVISTKSNEK